MYNCIFFDNGQKLGIFCIARAPRKLCMHSMVPILIGPFNDKIRNQCTAMTDSGLIFRQKKKLQVTIGRSKLCYLSTVWNLYISLQNSIGRIQFNHISLASIWYVSSSEVTSILLPTSITCLVQGNLVKLGKCNAAYLVTDCPTLPATFSPGLTIIYRVVDLIKCHL